MLVRNLSFGLLFLLTVAGGWYLKHPEFWRWKEPSPRLRQVAEPAVAAVAIVAPPSERIAKGEAFVDAEGCHAVPVKAVDRSSGPAVYRWTDENGRTSFGDRPPAGVNATRYDVGAASQPRYFDLKIEYVGRGSVPFLHNRLQANTTKIYELLADLVGDSRLRQVELNLKVYETQAEFLAYARRKPGLGLDSPGGFYSLLDNEAVTFRYPDDGETLAVARHEAVHVIVAGLLGSSTPLWLNEGLAEYFEGLDVRGQYAEVPVNSIWLNLARSAVARGYPSRLDAYLTLGANAWYGQMPETHYALGWSLVYFLMDSATGRAALGRLLRDKADRYCEMVDHTNWMQTAYPGGAPGLHRDFFAWLHTLPATSRHRH